MSAAYNASARPQSGPEEARGDGYIDIDIDIDIDRYRYRYI